MRNIISKNKLAVSIILTVIFFNALIIISILLYSEKNFIFAFIAWITLMAVAVIYLLISKFDKFTSDLKHDQSKSEFVSMACHKLRAPLSVARWYSEMLLNGDAGPLNKNQKEYIQEIYKGTKKMVDIMGALLSTSRIEMELFKIDPKMVDIIDIANNVIDELSSKIKKKKIDFKKEFDENLPKIRLDEKLTEVVFRNLLHNAIDYNSEKGSILFKIYRKNKSIEIMIRDSGMGIPTEQQSMIFTKLFRADNARESDANGKGLELYIVKAILERAGGDIWFNSQENKGSTFFVSIPLSGMQKKQAPKTLC